MSEVVCDLASTLALLALSLGQHKPGPTVDEFTGRVEVSGVYGCLGKHVEDDLADVVEPPVGEELFGPPGGRGI